MDVADKVVEALKLITRGVRSADSLEDQYLEFKTDKPTIKETAQDLAEAAVCFANASGGSVVLGVADKMTGPSAMLGSRFSADDLRTRIHSLTDPALTVEVARLRLAEAELIVVQVPQGLDVFSTSKGLVTRRWNDRCIAMRPTDVSRLDDERRGTDWTAQTSGRPWDDVDAGSMARLRQLLSGSQDRTRQSLALRGDLDLLRNLKLVADDKKLTRAGEILLCRSPTSTGQEILVYQYRATPGGEATAVRRWSTPLVEAFSEAIDSIGARIGLTPINTSGGQQLQVEDYPLIAVREALANALLHGDYRDRRPVQIEHSPASLTVRSPGPLVSGITPDNILTMGSRARFPSLAAAFRVLGLAEELGQGVDRMFREMARTGRAIPEVTVEEGGSAASTVITFRGGPPNARVTKFIADLPPHEREDTDALLIVLLLCQKKSVTVKDVGPVIQRDASSSEAVLRRLATGEAELVEPTPGTAARAHPNYRLRAHTLAALGPAVLYHRRSPLDSDRKIVEHVREYQTINSAAVQRLFDMDVYQARDVLRDLVGRELLVRVSVQKRGVAVKYGPGPLFPERGSRWRAAGGGGGPAQLDPPRRDSARAGRQRPAGG